MGYEYSNRGPGGLSALEATIGADTCGWECDLADGVDGLGIVPIPPLLPGGMVQSGRLQPRHIMQPIGTPIQSGSVQPIGYGSAIPVVPSGSGFGQQQLSECARARYAEAVAALEVDGRCATSYTAEGIPIVTAQSVAACTRARLAFAQAQIERVRRCGTDRSR